MEKIKNYINRVRSRSEEEKKRAAITWTIILTILIFIIWASTFSLSVINRQNEDAQLRARAAIEAKKALVASTTTIVADQTNGSWLSQLGNFMISGADSISNGFWTVGSWLHK